MSELYVNYDVGKKKDDKAIVVCSREDGKIQMLSARLGKDAENLYKILTDQSVRFTLN